MLIKTLKKIVGVLFAISKDLKAIRKALEKKSESNTSHQWIEDYIDERLTAKKHRIDYLKSVKAVDESINKDLKES